MSRAPNHPASGRSQPSPAIPLRNFGAGAANTSQDVPVAMKSNPQLNDGPMWKTPRFWTIVGVVSVVLLLALGLGLGLGLSSSLYQTYLLNQEATANIQSTATSVVSGQNISAVSLGSTKASDLLQYAFGVDSLPFSSANDSVLSVLSSSVPGLSSNLSLVSDIYNLVTSGDSIRDKILQFLDLTGLTSYIPKSLAIQGTLEIAPNVSVDATLLLYVADVQVSTKPEYAIIFEIGANISQLLSNVTSINVAVPSVVRTSSASFLENLLATTPVQVIVASADFEAEGHSFIYGVSLHAGINATTGALADAVTSLVTSSNAPLTVGAYFPFNSTTGYLRAGMHNVTIPIGKSDIQIDAFLLAADNIGSANTSVSLALAGSISSSDVYNISFGAVGQIALPYMNMTVRATTVSVPGLEKVLTFATLGGSVALTKQTGQAAVLNSLAFSGEANFKALSGSSVKFALSVQQSNWYFVGSTHFNRLSAADIVKVLSGGKADVSSHNVLNQLAVENFDLRVSAANSPFVFDDASLVLAGVTVSATGSLSLPTAIVNALSNIGIVTSENNTFAVLVYVPTDMVNNDAKIVVAPQLPTISAGKLTLNSIGAYASFSTSRFDLGYRVVVNAVIGGSSLSFYSVGTASNAGVNLAGGMFGTWNNAFGINGLMLANVSSSITFVPPASITSFGIAATFGLGGATFSVAGHVDPAASNYGVYAKVNNFTLPGLVEFIAAQVKNNNGLITLANRLESAKLFDIEYAEFSAADSNFVADNVEYKQGVAISANGTVLGITFGGYVRPATSSLTLGSIPDFEVGLSVADVSVQSLLQAFRDSNVLGLALRNSTITLAAKTITALKNAASAIKTELETIANSVGDTLTSVWNTISNCLFKLSCKRRRSVDPIVQAIDNLFSIKSAGFNDFSILEFVTLSDKDLGVYFNATFLSLPINVAFTLDLSTLKSNPAAFVETIFTQIVKNANSVITANSSTVMSGIVAEIKDVICQSFLKTNC